MVEISASCSVKLSASTVKSPTSPLPKVFTIIRLGIFLKERVVPPVSNVNGILFSRGFVASTLIDSDALIIEVPPSLSPELCPVIIELSCTFICSPRI